MNNKNTIQNEDGMPIIGWLVNWSASGFEIGRDALVKQLENAGIDPNVARTVLPKNAAIRAVRENAKGKDKFHRKVIDDKNRAAFAIVETGQPTEGDDFDVNLDVGTKATYDKDAHAFNVVGHNKNAIETSFKNRLDTYASDQFRSIILRYVKRYCAGVTYLETGNLYFVPVAKKTELNKLQALFTAIGSSVKLCVKEEISTKQIRSVMWNLAIKEVTHDIGKLKIDLENLDDGTSERSIEVRLRKYEAVRTKCEMFESALSGTASDLKAQLDELTKLVRAKVVDSE